MFEQDTGAHALHVGFPVLHLPPGSGAVKGAGQSRRVLAPIAFIPISLLLKQGRAPGVELSSAGEGIDKVMPNTALLVWLEQMTGKKLKTLFADEAGEDPWREIAELTAAVKEALELPDAPRSPRRSSCARCRRPRATTSSRRRRSSPPRWSGSTRSRTRA